LLSCGTPPSRPKYGEVGVPVNSDFRDLFAALNAAGARYLLAGGYAVAFQIGVPPNRIDILTSIDGVSFDEA
jgi:hypothetical protein